MVILCVFTDEQVQQTACRTVLVAAMKPHASLVIHTSGSPAKARTIAAQFREVDVVDAPASGGPHNVAARDVTLFVGGSDEAVA